MFIPQCLPLLNPQGQPNAGGRATCTTPAPTGINGIQNVGRSTLKGIEVDGTLNFGDSFKLDFGYAYGDAVVTDGGNRLPACDNTRFNCDQATFLTAGLALPYAPKHRITLTGNVKLPVPESLGKMSLGATFTHTSSYFSNHGSDRAFAQGAVPFNASIAPATSLLNLNYTWSDMGGLPLDLAMFVTNVTGKEYYVSAANGLASTGAEFLLLGAPRMFGVRFKWRFGD